MTGQPHPDHRLEPAYYAVGGGGWRNWWSLLHPPYTAWHLSYVAIGAALARPVALDRLGWTLLGFFLALGVGAHALDEMHGHPLRTGISDAVLAATAAVSVAAACAIGWLVGGLRLLPFIAVGVLLVFGYNLEWFGGALHNVVGMALSWGAFPVLTGFYVQRWTVSVAAIAAGAGAFALTMAQRALSTPARQLRRSVTAFSATATLDDDRCLILTRQDLLRPLEQALRAISWGLVALAIGLVLAAR
jgi:hypothetical protein